MNSNINVSNIDKLKSMVMVAVLLTLMLNAIIHNEMRKPILVTCQHKIQTTTALMKSLCQETTKGRFIKYAVL